MLTLGQIKLYMGPVNKNPKKKFKILIFEYAKLDVCKKNASAKKIEFFLLMYIKRSGSMSRFQN